MIGRPPCYSKDKASRVLEAVRRGLTYHQAAAYAGISYSTLNRWRQQGQWEEAGGKYREFWIKLEQANGEAALRLVGRIEDAAEGGDWKAASWILERRFPLFWGKNPKHPNDPLEPIRNCLPSGLEWDDDAEPDVDAE